MDLVMYESRRGKQQSGAYLFLPYGKARSLFTPNTKPRITMTTGPLVSGRVVVRKIKFPSHRSMKWYLMWVWFL